MADRPAVPASADIEVLGHALPGQPRSRRSARSHARHAGDCDRPIWRRARSDRRSASSRPTSRASCYRQLPVPRRIVLALGARVGLAHGFNREISGGTIPACRRADDQRPARERALLRRRRYLGPRVRARSPRQREHDLDDGFPDRRQQRGGVEQRAARQLFGAFQGIGFLDAGNVFPLASDLDFIDLRPAAGFGLAYKSQRIGLARVDLGFNLNPQEFVPGARERRWVLHFLLGQPF